jgi:hypothetical protein
MTFEERVRALTPFGFSDRQTRFLVTVALHSGFCLRRHYAVFAGLQYGQGIRDFLDRLVRRRLASCVTFRRDRGLVYHVHASTLYEAIGQDDNRNRRATSPALIARKLMLLDYVLGAPLTEWYATEQDKVALFTRRFGLRLADLPHRLYRAQPPGAESTTRYFIHKLPIAVTGDPAVVSFVHLVTDTTGRAFRQFLEDHARLLARLPDWRIVAVYPPDLHGLTAGEVVFRQFAEAIRRPRPASEVALLRQYFQTRDVQERGDITRLSVSDIDALRAARHRYSAPAFERLYRQWQRDGEAAFSDRSADAVAAAIETGRGQLLTSRLLVRYDRFGTRAGVA